MLKIAFVVMVALMISLSGCTASSVGCTVQGGADLIIAPAIAVGLQCSNEDAILASLKEIGQKAGICTVAASPAPAPTVVPSAQALKIANGGILTAICLDLGQNIVTQLGKAIPAEWGCAATNASAALGGVIGTACNLIPAVQQVAAAAK